MSPFSYLANPVPTDSRQFCAEVYVPMCLNPRQLYHGESVLSEDPMDQARGPAMSFAQVILVARFT